jgi:hypothetical protein
MSVTIQRCSYWITGIQAARAAAALRKDNVDVETVAGRYGEFKVFVDGEEVLSAGPLAFLGVLPSIDDVREAVRTAQGDKQDE